MASPVIHLDRAAKSPFTGWSGEVINYAALPIATSVDGEFWMVLNATGSRFLLNYRASGLYLSESGSWRKINNAQLLLNDAQFAVYNTADNTKQIAFDVSVIGTGTKRTATWPNKDGTVAMLSDITSGGPSLRNVTSTDTFATPSETINCTSGTFTVNLPTAVGIQGTTYTLVNSGIGIITLDPNGTETINGSLTIDIKKQYVSRTVQSDGTNWIII